MALGSCATKSQVLMTFQLGEKNELMDCWVSKGGKVTLPVYSKVVINAL